MLRLTINNTEIPLPENVGISLNKELFDPLKIGEKKSDYSKTFTLPGTPELNKLLGHIFAQDQRIRSTATTQFNPDYNPNIKATAKLDLDGITMLKGFCRLTEIREIHENEIEYDITMFAPQADFFTQIRERKMRQLDFSDLNHDLTATNISDSWATQYKRGGVNQSFALGEGYVYPLIVRENDPKKGFTNWSIDQLRPALFVKEVLDKIFDGTDFIYSATSFFTDTRFKRLTIPALDNSFEVGSAAMDAEEFLAECTLDEGLTVGEILKFDNDSTGGNFDTPGAFNNATYRYTTNYGGWYTFRLVGQFTCANTSGNPLFATIGLCKNGNAGSAAGGVVQVYFATGTNTVDVDHDFTIFCDAGDVLDLRLFRVRDLSNNDLTSGWTLTEESGSTFTGTITSATVGQGNELNLIEFFKTNLTQEAFVSGLCKMFNLVITPDEDNPYELHFTPYPSFHGTTAFSLESHRDVSKQLISIPLGELTAQTYKFKYKQAKEAESTYFANTFGDPYGSYIYNVPNDFVKDIKEVELPFASTPFAPGAENSMALPYLGQYGQTGEEIHILIYGGLKACQNPWTLWTKSGWAGSTNTYTTYPFFGHIDDPFNPTYDISFGMPPLINLPNGGRVIYTNDNLYNKYWRKYIDQITDKDSRVVIGWFRLRAIDWYNLTFDKLYQFKGQNYRLIRVDDHNPECTDVTKLTFLRSVEPVAFAASTGTKGRGYDNTDGYGDRYPTDSVPVDKLNKYATAEKPVQGMVLKGYKNTVLKDPTFVLGMSNIVTAEQVAILASEGTLVTAERVVSILEDDETRDNPGLFIQGTEVEFTAPSDGDILTYSSGADKWAGAAPGALSFTPIFNAVNVDDTVTETAGYVIYEADGAANIALDLPAAAGNTAVYVFKNASTSNNLRIDAADSIEGAANYTLLPEEAIQVYSNGSTYRIY